MEKQVRAHVVISGKVQGVFFRMETKGAAQRFGVSGWVRNKRDGNVEAMFEGNQKNVELILDWCKKGASLSRVKKVDIKWEGYKGEFDGFAITY